MSSGSANKLIPLLAIGAVVGVVAILLFGDRFSSPSQKPEVTSGEVPIGFDADTPQDTLQTITKSWVS